MIDINKLVYKLSSKFQTRNPFEIANCLGIIITMEKLGKIGGYYRCTRRIKRIHINSELTTREQKFVCAHELGHAILHPYYNNPFMISHTYVVTDKFEKEANIFAANLLIPNEIILENWNMTSNQLSRLMGYEKKLIELRLEDYRKIY